MLALLNNCQCTLLFSLWVLVWFFYFFKKGAIVPSLKPKLGLSYSSTVPVLEEKRWSVLVLTVESVRKLPGSGAVWDFFHIYMYI